MRKKIVNHCLLGALLGGTVSVFLHLFFGFLRGDGEIRIGYDLIRVYGSELNAMAAQYLSSMLVGMIWAPASLIFFDTTWSLLKKTAVHASVCMVPSLLIAYVMHWMPRSMGGLMQYVWLFGIIYAINWVAQYFCLRRQIKQFNAHLNQMRDCD